jgi:SAM-dependent methyltransferase
MCEEMTDHRQYAPATVRNRDFILDVLRDVLPTTGVILEIASGSGEHVVHFARNLPSLVFQPSDPEPEALLSVAAWVKDAQVTNVRAPIVLDASQLPWPIGSADGIICINMVHISSWDATIGLITGAAAILPPGSPLYLYGPYRRKGIATSPSNEAFDRNLRDRNPTWGLRDLEAVAAIAQSVGFSAPTVTEMPANNLSVVFRCLSR